MRSMFALTVIAFAIVIAFTGCQSTQRVSQDALAADTDPIETSTATLTVHGMGCPLCANNVDKQLLTVEGVEAVNIDLGSGQVKVHLDEINRPSRAQLARAIDQSGFTLVKIETP